MNLLTNIKNYGSIFKTKEEKIFFYLKYDLRTIITYIQCDWKFYIEGILKEKLEENEEKEEKLNFKYRKKAFLLLKYLNILNTLLHTYESIYSVLLKDKLSGKEKNSNKLKKLIENKIIEKNSDIYFYFKYLNLVCSAFRNKVSHGSILNIAVYIVNYLDQDNKDFQLFMDEASKENNVSENINIVEGTKMEYIESKIRETKIKFFKDLKKVDINITINSNEIISQINNIIEDIKSAHSNNVLSYECLSVSKIEESKKQDKLKIFDNEIKNCLKLESDYSNLKLFIENTSLHIDDLIEVIQKIINILEITHNSD